MARKVLLMNDLPGYGKVALSAMIPVLSRMGVHVFNLPTALVSNTLDYGKFQILDTTAYLEKALAVWEELGFSFEAVSTGFLYSQSQARLIADYCSKQSRKNVKIFCDPIMADNGKFYHGMDHSAVEIRKELVSCADYITPNYTEAVFLTGSEYRENPSEQEIRKLIEKLREIGAKSVLITSVCIDGVHQVSCYDAAENAYFAVPYPLIPAKFPGTGDLFSAVFLGSMVNGADMASSVSKAVFTVKRMIEKSFSYPEKRGGIPIEACLDVLEEPVPRP